MPFDVVFIVWSLDNRLSTLVDRDDLRRVVASREPLLTHYPLLILSISVCEGSQEVPTKSRTRRCRDQRREEERREETRLPDVTHAILETVCRGRESLPQDATKTCKYFLRLPFSRIFLNRSRNPIETANLDQCKYIVFTEVLAAAVGPIHFICPGF